MSDEHLARIYELEMENNQLKLSNKELEGIINSISKYFSCQPSEIGKAFEKWINKA